MKAELTHTLFLLLISIIVHLASQCLLNNLLGNKICLMYLQAMYGNNRHNCSQYFFYWISVLRPLLYKLLVGHFHDILARTHPPSNLLDTHPVHLLSWCITFKCYSSVLMGKFCPDRCMITTSFICLTSSQPYPFSSFS